MSKLKILFPNAVLLILVNLLVFVSGCVREEILENVIVGEP